MVEMFLTTTPLEQGLEMKMKSRTINIKDGELIRININGVTETLLLRSDADETIFISHLANGNYSKDWSLMATQLIKEHENND